jgi:hypothetical protein
LEFGVHSPA